MKLKEYLLKYGIRTTFFAEKIGVSKTTLLSWLKGNSMPRIESILLVEKETQGFVKAKDWVVTE